MKALILLIIFQVHQVLQANPIGTNKTQYNDANEVDLNWRLPK